MQETRLGSDSGQSSEWFRASTNLIRRLDSLNPFNDANTLNLFEYACCSRSNFRALDWRNRTADTRQPQYPHAITSDLQGAPLIARLRCRIYGYIPITLLSGDVYSGYQVAKLVNITWHLGGEKPWSHEARVHVGAPSGGVINICLCFLETRLFISC